MYPGCVRMNFLRLLAVLMCVTVLAMPARAETSIAVVDVQMLLSQSDAAKSIASQVDVYKEKFLSEVSEEERSLKETEKQLSEQRNSLDKEEFAQKAKDFEKRLYAMRQATASRRKALDLAHSNGMSQVREKVYEIVGSIAAERGYDLVITKQNVIVGKDEIDLTAESMKRLNTALPSVSVTLKEAEKEPAGGQ